MSTEISRRTVAKSAAWAAPVIASAVTLPSASASPMCVGWDASVFVVADTPVPGAGTVGHITITNTDACANGEAIPAGTIYNVTWDYIRTPTTASVLTSTLTLGVNALDYVIITPATNATVSGQGPLFATMSYQVVFTADMPVGASFDLIWGGTWMTADGRYRVTAQLADPANDGSAATSNISIEDNGGTGL